MDPISNEDLKESFDRHAADDKLFQDAQSLVNEQTAKSLEAIHKRISDLATKEDISELKDFMGRMDVGLGVIRFTWNNAGKIGSVIVMVAGMYLVLKYGVVGAVSWAVSKGIL